ncbi:N-formylglutamate amidohydrolase [Motiliproteus sp. SC1-56]|uniref:N-formylglutamate amidohydrolase n=1 Tax=Motiliproteus sp. SC1-56 TaxID=2799565 RepID=UPI001A8FB899|nr:N-formylglutamate amidohydrolase [Motiliproteus sp. SC1-56]
MDTTNPRPKQAGSLLSPDDPRAFTLINPTAVAPLLLVCDHASNYIPPHLNHLGLPPSLREDHIAWDRGAADLVQLLSDRLECRAVLANYSRLLIDVNRDPKLNEPSLIPEVSDNHPIPGNQGLTPEERRQRVLRISDPYHHEIERQLLALGAFVKAPMIFSIHTFTPAMRGGQPRPWHAGMLWNQDPRIAKPLMAHLRRHEHLMIGDNEPYSGREFAYTIDRHGHAQGLPNCAIEIRQDLLESHEACLWWADKLSDGLQEIMKHADVFQVRFYPDQTEQAV